MNKQNESPQDQATDDGYGDANDIFIVIPAAIAAIVVVLFIVL